MGDCRVNERTLPNAAVDQTVPFNTFGRYVRVLAAAHVIQSNVKYAKDANTAIVVNWPSKTATVVSTWGYNPSNFAITAPNETSFNFKWPWQPSWGQPGTGGFTNFVLQENGNLLENGSSVWRPESVGDGYFHMSQVMVYDLNGNNIALRKPATSTSSWPGTGAPSVLVDGATAPRGSPIWHNNSQNRADYWEVDLGSVQMIKSVRIFSRIDCCQYRIPGTRIRVLQNTTDPIVTGTCLTTDAKAAADVAAIKAAADAAAAAAKAAADAAAAKAAANAKVAADKAAADKAAADKLAANLAAAANAARARTNTTTPRPLVNAMKAAALRAKNTMNTKNLKSKMNTLMLSVLKSGGGRKKMTRKKRNSGRKTRRRR